MKKNFLLHIIILLVFTSCSSQNKRIEKEFIDCSYQAYADNGTKLKMLISDYQKLLIKEKILTDSTAKSYRNLFQEIANGNKFTHISSKSFFEQLQTIEQPDRILIEECQLKILRDSAKYDITKLRMLENAISSVQNSGDIEPSLIAQQILSVLTVKDFELDYYKLRTMLLFDVLNEDFGIENKLRTSTGKVIEHDLKNALKISTNEKNEIFVNSRKVSVEKLKEWVKEYVEENKSNSVIWLSTSRETMYSSYIDIQNTITSAIQYLRDKHSNNEYQMEFGKLTDEQKEKIQNIYPIEIVETKPE